MIDDEVSIKMSDSVPTDGAFTGWDFPVKGLRLECRIGIFIAG